MHTLPNNSTHSHLDTSAFCLVLLPHLLIFSCLWHSHFLSVVSLISSCLHCVSPFLPTLPSPLLPQSIHLICPPFSSCLHCSALELSASFVWVLCSCWDRETAELWCFYVQKRRLQQTMQWRAVKKFFLLCTSVCLCVRGDDEIQIKEKSSLSL